MQRTPKTGPAHERGTTLMETMIALALVFLIIGAAAASIGRFVAQKTVAGWSDSIVNDIRGAQQLSIAQRATTVVTFTDSTPAGYTTTVGGTTVRSQTLPQELTLTEATIEFNTLGVPLSAATLTLTNARNSQTVTISVAPVTGAVTVQ